MAGFHKTAETHTPGATTLPQAYLVSPDIFAAERRRILARRWTCVAHHSEIPNPGDFVARDIAGESLLVVRGDDGDLRTFFNVCRHRGSRLTEAPGGTFRGAIRCPYHAWSYDLGGRLRGAPHMDDTPGFDKTQLPLITARTEQWEGLIFVTLDESADPITDAFAPLHGKFAAWNVPHLRVARRIDYDVVANWKLIFENYSECYHCPGVHPALARLTPYDQAENDLHEGPFLGGFMPVRAGGSVTQSGTLCAPPVGDLASGDLGRIYYYSIFPNLLLSLHPDYVMMHTLWPQSEARTRIRCEWLFHAGAFGRPDFHPEDAIEFWDVTNRQDWHVCEQSQLGASSRAYRPGPYSPRESIAAAFDREYLRVMEETGDEPTRPSDR